MPFVPVSDVVMAEMRMLLYGQKIENTLYFTKAGGFDLSEAAALNNILLLWWTEEYADGVSEDLSLREIVITDLSTETSFSLVSPAPTPNPTGAQSGGALPGGSALCVSFRTTSRGRSFRGRNFVSGIPRSGSTGNQVNSDIITLIEVAYQDLISLVADMDATWVVVSRFTDGAPRVAGINTRVNSVTVVDTNIDSQRRRLTGRGQ